MSEHKIIKNNSKGVNNEKKIYDIPVTFNDCDKLITDQNFDYINNKYFKNDEIFIGT